MTSKLPQISTRKMSSSSTSADSAEDSKKELTQLTRFNSLQENGRQSSFEEEKSSIDVFIDRSIGRGAYGQVFRALNKQNGKFLAVKVIKLSLTGPDWREKLEVLEKEIDLLRRFEHPNIVKYLGSDRNLPENCEEGEIKIYMEYMPGGSLSSILKEYGPFSESVIAKFTKQILLGLHYLHSHGVVHRDLKGGNILAASDGTVKLADFGASKHIQGLPLVSDNSELCRSIRGSLYWMAPEILRNEGYGRKVDIWSLGCVMIEMANGSHPWNNITNYHSLCLAIAQQQTPEIPGHCSDPFKDFVSSCLRYDKKLRPNTGALLKHEFLANCN